MRLLNFEAETEEEAVRYEFILRAAGFEPVNYNDPKPPRGLGRKGIFELNRALVKIGYRKIWEDF